MVGARCVVVVKEKKGKRNYSAYRMERWSRNEIPFKNLLV